MAIPDDEQDNAIERGNRFLREAMDGLDATQAEPEARTDTPGVPPTGKAIVPHGQASTAIRPVAISDPLSRTLVAGSREAIARSQKLLAKPRAGTRATTQVNWNETRPSDS